MSEFDDHFIIKPCANGCVRKGTEHLDQPQINGALHGHFCAREFYAIKGALEQAAEIVEHVVSLITFRASSEDNVQASKEPPLPFNVQAFNDANETYGRLVYWSQHWAGRLGRPKPAVQIGSWSQNDGNVVGLPADITPSGARVAVLANTTWLRAHLDLIMDTDPADDVAYFHDELQDVYRIAARWPFMMKPRFAKIPCPQDGTRIAVYPPNGAGDDMRIVCDNGHVYDEEKFEFYVREFAQIQATTKHLTAKYAS